MTRARRNVSAAENALRKGDREGKGVLWIPEPDIDGRFVLGENVTELGHLGLMRIQPIAHVYERFQVRNRSRVANLNGQHSNLLNDQRSVECLTYTSALQFPYS